MEERKLKNGMLIIITLFAITMLAVNLALIVWSGTTEGFKPLWFWIQGGCIGWLLLFVYSNFIHKFTK